MAAIRCPLLNRIVGRGAALAGRLAWGDGGSGPAQLALAILLHFVDRATATRLYQAFKWDCIATLPQEDFQLRGEEVLAWLDEEGRTLPLPPEASPCR